MLTRSEIEDIISEKGKFSDFVSASMVLAFTKGLEQTKNSKTPLSAISNFIETLRKTRADLTGDSHEGQIPRMMVNIQFGSAPKAVALPIEGEIEPNPAKIEAKKDSPATSQLRKQVDADFDRFFGESNLGDVSETPSKPPKTAVPRQKWQVVDSERLDLWDDAADEDTEISDVESTSPDS